MNRTKCPDCLADMATTASTCPCGWSKPTVTKHDAKCVYGSDNVRCAMQYDLAGRHGKRMCAWHAHCAMFRVDPTDHDKFLAFVVDRQKPSAMQKVLEQNGIKTPKSQWDGDPSCLWEMVNGRVSRALSAA